MRRALADDFRVVEGVDVVFTLDPRCSAGESSAEAVLVDPGDEEATLRRLAVECDYTVLIAPETGGLLARRSEIVREVGARNLGSTPSAVALTADKQRLAAHLAGLGISTPPVELYDPASPAEPSFDGPRVVKPRDGAGSIDTWFVKSLRDPPVVNDAGRQWLLQPFVEGSPMSASFLMEPGGGVQLIGVGWQNMVIAGGRFCYEGGLMPGPVQLGLEEPLRAVRSVPGLFGYVGVDFIHQKSIERSTVIEINPRLTTSFVGWQRVFRTGSIAKRWLGAFDQGTQARHDVTIWSPPDARVIRFTPDGTILAGEGAEE